MKLALVHATGSNRFMAEILEGIAYEANLFGVEAHVVFDEFPDDDDTAYVVIPHEYFAIAPRTVWPNQSQLGRTIALTVEHPGTQWFEVSAGQARRCGAVMDINRDAAAALRRAGFRVDDFQIGYTPFNDEWKRADSQRDIDILYLGSTDTKRDRLLASYAPTWIDAQVTLMIPGQEPRPEGLPDYAVGKAKWSMLANSKTLVNLHRDRSQALEWVRVIEAISNGCVVFSEHSVDAWPLVAGQHFVSATGGSLGILAAAGARNPQRLEELRNEAYDFVTSKLRLSTSVEKMLAVGSELIAHPRKVPAVDSIATPSAPLRRRASWELHEGNVDPLAEAVGRVERRLISLARELPRKTDEVGSTDVPADVRSAAYDAAHPRITVAIPMYNGASLVGDALSSAIANEGVDSEIIVVDDGSHDDSAATVARFIDEHPLVPLQLIRSSSNLGPSGARNALLAAARGEFIFMLDHDNGIYRNALSRLQTALVSDEGAAFAYAPIAVITDGKPRGLISSRPWNPDAFRFDNYIDNMALYRTSVLREFGGWNTSLPHWEDFHLLLRLAEAGQRAAFVPQVLAWYRVSSYSMSQEAAVHRRWLWSQMRAAAPTVLHD
jgi:GT2 family glycosyltransferase